MTKFSVDHVQFKKKKKEEKFDLLTSNFTINGKIIILRH